MNRTELHRFLFLVGAVFIIDQLTKLIVWSWFPSTEHVINLLPILNIVYEQNPGVAFSLGNSLGEIGRWIFICVSIVISVFLFIWLQVETTAHRVMSFGLIIGGAMGNMVDRVWVGAVIDWVDFHVGGWHYPTFNIADTAIFFGAMILIYEALFTPSTPTNSKRL